MHEQIAIQVLLKAYIADVNKASLCIIIVFYVIAGVNHFVHPEFYIKIMPPWLNYQDEFVLISGILEVLLSLLMIFPQTRRVGAWGIILLLVAVFPANVQMMLNYIHENNPQLWIAIVRLPLQIPLIWWAYSFAKRD